MVATGVLYLAVHCCKLVIPASDVAKKQWWEVFSPGYSEEKLQDIACQLMQCVTSINKSDIT